MSDRDETHRDPPTVAVACWGGCGDEVRVLVRKADDFVLCRECARKPKCPACEGEGCAVCGHTGRAL